jgi:(p)ppGpp synthase/HD superfamily hydrolase
MLTDRYKSALQFAATVHDGHVRKGTEIAYLSHLISVSALVMENGGNETEAIAALLHDAIEDQGTNYVSDFRVTPREGRDALKRDIKLLFGPEVLAIVEHCTDDEYLPGGRTAQKGTPAEWKKRKQAYMAKLGRQDDRGVLRVSCADKLHNARAILADYEVEGEKLWQRFTAKTKALQLWYYDGLAKRFTQRAKAIKDPGLTRMARQLRAVVEAIRAHEPQPGSLRTSRQGDRQRTEGRTRDGSRAGRSMGKK